MEAVTDGAGAGQSHVLQTCVLPAALQSAGLWLLPDSKGLLPLRSKVIFLLMVVEMFLQVSWRRHIGHRAVVNN